jgi:hypothetical protein
MPTRQEVQKQLLKIFEKINPLKLTKNLTLFTLAHKDDQTLANLLLKIRHIQFDLPSLYLGAKSLEGAYLILISVIVAKNKFAVSKVGK